MNHFVSLMAHVFTEKCISSICCSGIQLLSEEDASVLAEGPVPERVPAERILKILGAKENDNWAEAIGSPVAPS